MAGRMESDSWHDKSIHEYLVVGSDGDAEWLGGLWVWWVCQGAGRLWLRVSVSWRAIPEIRIDHEPCIA
jgi:hypothetical protein